MFLKFYVYQEEKVTEFKKELFAKIAAYIQVWTVLLSVVQSEAITTSIVTILTASVTHLLKFRLQLQQIS
jgi:hypothetical protein